MVPVSYTHLYASAIGACAAAPEKQLEVINGVSDDVYKAAELLVESGKVVVGHADVPQKLYIEVIAHGDTHTARAVIADLHTNLIALEVDGESVMTAGGLSLIHIYFWPTVGVFSLHAGAKCVMLFLNNKEGCNMGYTFGFIGAGNMGGALARAACRWRPEQVVLTDRTLELSLIHI